MVKDLSPFQLIVDSFDYKKAGVTESLVRDLQVMWMGQIFLQWRNVLLETSVKQIAGISTNIIKFIRTISLRTLNVFERQNEVQMASDKDYVGLNLLMALTLYVVSRQAGLQSPEKEDDLVAKESGLSEELPSLMKLVKGAKVSDLFKFDFAKFYPSRFSMSTLLLALTFLIETPSYQPSTFPMIKQLLPV